MTVSVVMATYNGARFIEEQLDTIREQTKTVDELIICDDGSTDNTIEIVKEYISNYELEEKWHIYENSVNLGYANNFYHAASFATGDLLFFADQDDRWNADKIQIMEKIMEEHEDCVVLCSDFLPWFFENQSGKVSESTKASLSDKGTLEKVEMGNRSLYIGAIGCCMCIRGDFYKNVDQYWFDSWAQDDRMWRLAQCANGLYVIHSNLVWHRIHSKNTSTYGNYHNRTKRKNLFKNMFLACVQSEKAAEEFHASQREKKILSEHTSMMQKRYEMLEKRKPGYAWGLIKYLKYYQNYRSFLIDLYCLR